MRSTIEPMMSAGVMMANVIWKHMKTELRDGALQAVLAHAGEQHAVKAAEVGVVEVVWRWF